MTWHPEPNSPINARRRWSVSEKRSLVIARKADVGISELASRFGRTEGAVQGKLRDLGVLTRNIVPYSKEEDAVVLADYEKFGARYVAGKLNRPRNSVIGRANRLRYREQPVGGALVAP